MIEDGAREALVSFPAVDLYMPSSPIKIETGSVDKTAEFKGRAGVEITGALTAESHAADWMTAWDQSWPQS